MRHDTCSCRRPDPSRRRRRCRASWTVSASAAPTRPRLRAAPPRPPRTDPHRPRLANERANERGAPRCVCTKIHALTNREAEMSKHYCVITWKMHADKKYSPIFSIATYGHTRLRPTTWQSSARPPPVVPRAPPVRPAAGMGHNGGQTERREQTKSDVETVVLTLILENSWKVLTLSDTRPWTMFRGEKKQKLSDNENPHIR